MEPNDEELLEDLTRVLIQDEDVSQSVQDAKKRQEELKNQEKSE